MQTSTETLNQLRAAIRGMKFELDYPLNASEEWTKRRAILRAAIRAAGREVPYGAPPSELLAVAESLLGE